MGKPKIRPVVWGEFWLVQRLNLAVWKKQKAFYERPGVEVKSNPFGYGRMGDYELDYMGAAEFEFGAIPEANNRLAKAGKDLRFGNYEHRGHSLDFLWIGSEGEPFEAWASWVDGEPANDKYDNGPYERRPCEGKESPYELPQRLNGEDPWDKERGWRTAVYWALQENVLWAFTEDGHLPRMLQSMTEAPVEFLR